MQRLTSLAALVALAPLLPLACSSGDSGTGGASVAATGGGGGTTASLASGGGSSVTSTSNEGGGGAGGSGGTGGSGDTCSVDGNPGTCIDVSACAKIADHTSTARHCPGPADIECCTKTPNVDDNPPTPAGYAPMMQDDVTQEMTDWAVTILHDPDDYPMFATTMRTFGSLDVLARVEWHPPDFQNSVVHRGVTLYEPE